MKIYTKTGDAGDTSLFGGKRVPKSSLRIDAYGTVDELNAQLGVVRALKPNAEVDKTSRTNSESTLCAWCRSCRTFRLSAGRI